MKRIFYFAFCILTCLAVMTACGNSGSADNDTEAASNVSAGENTTADDSDEAIDNNHADDDQVEEVPVGEVTPSEEDKNDSTDNTEEDVDSTESDLTDAQENVAEDPEKEFQASGTFNGFIDSSSIEVTMSDGTYQTFFVYDETAKNRLAQLEGSETPPTIQFVYKAREGQRNPEIISVN